MRESQRLDATVAPSFPVTTVAWKPVDSLLTFGLCAGLLAFAVFSARHTVDFPIYHRIAQQVWQGHYDLYPDAVYRGESAPAHGFRYAPAVAFLLVPLAWLSLEHAALLFFGLKVAALIHVGTAVMRHVGLRTPSRTLWLLALVCVGGYVAEELRYGNVHTFVVALMVFAFDAAASGSVLAPAAALAVAIATKLTPVLLLAYFVMRRRFAVCVATIGVLVLLAILPAAVVGIHANTRLLEGFGRYAVEKVGEGDNYSLRGVLVRYIPSDAPRTLTTVWMGTVLVGGVAAAAVLWRAPAVPLAAMLDLSIVLTGMLLASPHTQRRYFVALFVPMATLAASLANAADEIDRRLMAFGLAVTAAAGTLLPLIFGGRRLALWYEAGSPYFYGTLALFVTLIWLRARVCNTTQARRDEPASVAG